MALAFHSNSLALQSPSSHLCPPASPILPETPPASRSELAQPRLCRDSSPGAAHMSRCAVSGLRLGCELLAACFSWHSTQTCSQVAQQARRVGAGQRGHWQHLPSITSFLVVLCLWWLAAPCAQGRAEPTALLCTHAAGSRVGPWAK